MKPRPSRKLRHFTPRLEVWLCWDGSAPWFWLNVYGGFCCCVVEWDLFWATKDWGQNFFHLSHMFTEPIERVQTSHVESTMVNLYKPTLSLVDQSNWTLELRISIWCKRLRRVVLYELYTLHWGDFCGILTFKASTSYFETAVICNLQYLCNIYFLKLCWNHPSLHLHDGEPIINLMTSERRPVSCDWGLRCAELHLALQLRSTILS